ncbi:tetratricopeptide repeat protein [Belliella marina]|uniref:Tetratricopeptide repeat protein n=1 Tax=Belliella marina TaxID=1644146 RepID=A0ABW4VKP2_9BACT
MKKSLLTLSAIFIFTGSIFAQLYKEGIVNRKFDLFQVGDTVKVHGLKSNDFSGKTQYLVKTSFGNIFVNEDRVDLFTNDFNFWENLWFESRALDISEKGWQSENRQALYEDAMVFFEEVKGNNLIFEDELLYDYIYQLIFKIHPEHLMKDKNRVFNLIILKSTEPQYFSFENGMIVMTTGAISMANSEKELTQMLTECISHIVLEHNLVNLNHAIKTENRARTWGAIATFASAAVIAYGNEKNGTYYNFDDALNLGLAASYMTVENLQRIGAKYNDAQNKLVSKVSEEYWSKNAGLFNDNNKLFLAKISNAVSYTAWQEFHSKNYEYALKLANKMESFGMATEEEYLLLSKLYRKLGNDLDTNLQALTYVKEAEKLAPKKLKELDLEAGLIYMRMDDFDNARDAFQRYKSNLVELENSGEDVQTELKFVNQLLYRFNMEQRENIGYTDK